MYVCVWGGGVLRLYVYDNNGAPTGIDCRFSCLANSIVVRSSPTALSLALTPLEQLLLLLLAL